MNLEKLFHLKENHTDVKTEIMAGITTFMTMAYILAVNPNILSAAGMDRGAVFTATALSSFIATCLMALLSNYPFVLAPGMGLNAYFAYTVVLGMGYSWQQALVAVFVEGIIFILLSLTNVREAIFNSIPMTLKHAVSVGIGLFIAFIGLQNAKIVVNNDSTLVSMFSFKGSMSDGSFNYLGITVLLALIGVLVTGILLVKNVKGGILWGILITWALGILCQFVGLYVPNPDAGFYSLLPDFSNGISVPSMAPTFMKMDFAGVFSLDFIVIMFAFLFVDMFDILGPNMIGPSSSHTAGALRIAFVAGRMVERAVSVKFVLYGSFARTYHGHGTDRALVGGILGYHPDDERIRDSFEHAKEAGLAFSFEENFTDKEIYPNTVDIYVTDKDGSVVSLRGKSIGGGNAVITRLNGVDVELTGNYCTLVVEHVDKKGTLAFVTTVLSAYDLNIGSLRLYRESKGKRAYAIIEVDTNVSNQVVSALKGVESVTNVLVVPAIQLD